MRESEWVSVEALQVLQKQMVELAHRISSAVRASKEERSREDDGEEVPVQDVPAPPLPNQDRPVRRERRGRRESSVRSVRETRRARALSEIRREQEYVEARLRSLDSADRRPSTSRETRRPSSANQGANRSHVQTSALLQGIRASSIASSNAALAASRTRTSRPRTRQRRGAPNDAYLQNLVERHIAPHLPQLSITGNSNETAPHFLTVGDWSSRLSWVHDLDTHPDRAEMRTFLTRIMNDGQESRGLSKSELRCLSSFAAKRDQIRDPCCICIEPISEGQQATMLPCTHAFHAPCIKRWLAVSDVCPLCKMSARGQAK